VTIMTRRAALQSLLGATLLPIIKLDTSHETDLSTLVLEFCEDEHIVHTSRRFGDPQRRFVLDTPWEFLGDSVASDARALIRVPGLRYTPTGERGPFPDCDEVFRQCWHDDGRWLRLPRERLARPECRLDDPCHCPFCSRRECPDCNGVGEYYGLDDSGHNCPECHGHGYVARSDCELCHGDHRFRDVYDAAFGVPLNARYARLARRIPGAMWRAPLDNDGPVLFRGDGGVAALVMPVLARVEVRR